MMNRHNPYSEQVQLLVRILPLIATEKCFALKGGTAINMLDGPFGRGII
jgi:hypothetical protein